MMAAEGTDRPPTRMLRGVRLFPERQPVDVGLRNGWVISIGPVESVPRRRNREAGEDVDAQGLFLLPGLQDAHVHTVQEAARRHRFDLRSATSAEHAAAMVAVEHAQRRAEPAAAAEVLLGQGFRAGLWDDEPTAELLARAAPGRPVLLQSNDLHVAWLSPAALRLVGRDPGSAGLLRERDCFEAVARLAGPPRDRSDRWVAELTVDAAARGVTTLVDFEFADNLVDWTRRVQGQQVATRVVCVVPLHLLDEVAARGLRTGDVLPDTGGLLEVGPLKLFVDGSLNSRTALCHDPYPGSDEHGMLELPADELERAVRRGWRRGLLPGVHAIGDAAVTTALDVLERVGCPGRIEHAQLVARADLPGSVDRGCWWACSRRTHPSTVTWRTRSGPAAPTVPTPTPTYSPPAPGCGSVRMHPTCHSTHGTASPPQWPGPTTTGRRGIGSSRSRWTPPLPRPAVAAPVSGSATRQICSWSNTTRGPCRRGTCAQCRCGAHCVAGSGPIGGVHEEDGRRRRGDCAPWTRLLRCSVSCLTTVARWPPSAVGGPDRALPQNQPDGGDARHQEHGEGGQRGGVGPQQSAHASPVTPAERAARRSWCRRRRPAGPGSAHPGRSGGQHPGHQRQHLQGVQAGEVGDAQVAVQGAPLGEWRPGPPSRGAYRVAAGVVPAVVGDHQDCFEQAHHAHPDAQRMLAASLASPPRVRTASTPAAMVANTSTDSGTWAGHGFTGGCGVWLRLLGRMGRTFPGRVRRR